jgi:hypothetical protein
MEKDADKARINAKKAEIKAKEVYREFMQRHNTKKSSLNQLFENVYRANGVKREHYHGGKFNGVNCIRIMGNSEAIVLGTPQTQGFLQLCLQNKIAVALEETIQSVNTTGYLDSLMPFGHQSEAWMQAYCQPTHNNCNYSITRGKGTVA